jgi:hypothetical protein
MIARLGIQVAFVVALVAAAWFGVVRYGDSRVQAFRAEQAEKASAEAVARFRAQDIADAQTQDKKRKVVDSVRPALLKLRGTYGKQEKPVQAPLGNTDAGFTAEYRRVFNDAIDAANASIESAKHLP